MATARDVARQLGVAVSTVGRALADDRRISAQTRQRVRETADRLGYVGDTAAQVLRGGSSRLIGLMIPDVANEFYAAIAQALSDCIDQRGYRLVLMLTADDPGKESRQVREMLRARAAGLIIVPTSRPSDETVAMLRSLRFVQFLRQVAALQSPWFGLDDEQALFAATSRLVALGHRRIAYIGGKPALSTGAARLRGFRAALRQAELTGLEQLGDPRMQTGQEALARLMAAAEPPTALVTGSVHVTLGVVNEIERLGLSVPGDLSLFGFGDAAWFAWWRGGITAIRPPMRDLARHCGTWLLDSLQSPSGDPFYRVVCESTLVTRHTLAAPKACYR